ncbi:MAG: ABC transporter ATP-binding protein [Alphaproteobacteria bacterium]|jgi:ABC-2 type transport system ATP-binding protein|nr:ABC transporter ATP-binding protein [Alphaproteobacteria bacterium]MDP6589861.1 ABC transporter ATP-binding protein [Alphaproteobacteria bacterium]MDP6819436.1 ABC transporter ATP-binding protein [Alphaproteobacteria bacterium]
MSQPQNAIEARGLRKVYHRRGGDVVALHNFDLDIPRGSFFGLLGPNGAGKSTFINILAGLTNKSSGAATVWGFDLDRQTRGARKSIGVVPQELVLDPYFTAREALEAQAGYFGLRAHERRTNEILDTVGLTEQAGTYPRALSGGMRRRLMVAKALVHSPPIVILDEPTAGVDVELRRQLWAHLRELNGRGVTVVLTTHYLEEAEALCDRIAIIDKGKLIASEPTASLIERFDAKELVIVSAEDMAEIPAGLKGFETELRSPRRLAVRYLRSETEIGQILDVVRRAGVTIRDLSTDEPDLEDIFLHLTGSGAAPPVEAPPASHRRGGAGAPGIPGRRGPPGEDPSRPGGL